MSWPDASHGAGPGAGDGEGRAPHDSPRTRRLRSDLAAMERLVAESSLMRFRASGKPTQHYVIVFHGKSLARVRGRVAAADHHEVEIKLGAGYPRTMPEIRWLTPIYHPNISEIGMVCLGGYGTHWVPSLNLDELCGMLWDMARYHNYDVRSPYNREAALWVANQSTFPFPTDPRPLRDRRAALGRVEHTPHAGPAYPSLDATAKPAEAPSKVGRYADLVRRFAADLHGITPAGLTPAPDPEPQPERDAADGLLIIDDDPRKPDYDTPPARLRAADEEILFIE